MMNGNMMYIFAPGPATPPWDGSHILPPYEIFPFPPCGVVGVWHCTVPLPVVWWGCGTVPPSPPWFGGGVVWYVGYVWSVWYGMFGKYGMNGWYCMGGRYGM